MTEQEINTIADKLFDKIKQYLQPEEYVSKYTACKLLGMSRSNFDRLVSIRKLPKGIKRVGFKELAWRKSDLLLFLSRYPKKEKQWKMMS